MTDYPDKYNLLEIVHLLNDINPRTTDALNQKELSMAGYFHNIITAPEIYGLRSRFKDSGNSFSNDDYTGAMTLLRAKEFKYDEEGQVIKEPDTEIPEKVLKFRNVDREDWFAFLEHAAGMTVEQYRELTSQNRIIDLWGLSSDKPDDIETRARIIQQQKDKEEEDLYHFKRVGEMYKEHPFWGKSLDDIATAPGQEQTSDTVSASNDGAAIHESSGRGEPAGKKTTAIIPEHKGSSVFPTPPGTKWEKIVISFLNGDDVSIRIGGETIKTDYKGMGMIDGRGGGTSVQWKLLEKVAENHGDFPKGHKKKQRQLLAIALKSYFKLTGEPFKKLKRQWEADFTIHPEPK